MIPIIDVTMWAILFLASCRCGAKVLGEVFYDAGSLGSIHMKSQVHGTKSAYIYRMPQLGVFLCRNCVCIKRLDLVTLSRDVCPKKC